MPRFDYKKVLQNISIDDVAKRLGLELRAETPTRAKALCPFHDDKTPSLLLDSDRSAGHQHYYCFACGAYGDTIDLVKGVLDVGFKEAVQWLAPDSVQSQHRPRIVGNTPITSDNKSDLELGYQMYQAGGSNAELDAWIKQRQLDSATVRLAGFVHTTSNFLSQCLEAENDLSARREIVGALEDASLVKKIFPGVSETLHLPLNSGNVLSLHYSDFFIGDRIVFPLRDERGQLVGLGGRSVRHIVGSRNPKYQFTKGFPKASVLFRADHAFAQVRREAKLGSQALTLYLCEGFLDALRIEALGLPAVAVMGSTLSDSQRNLINEFADSFGQKGTSLCVVVCFDRDEAGLRGAADTCLKLINSPHVECRFCWPTDQQLSEVGQSPKLKDPDEYLAGLSGDVAAGLLAVSDCPPILAVLAFAFGTTAEDTLNDLLWKSSPRSRRYRAFSRASSQLRKVAGKVATELVQGSAKSDIQSKHAALADWITFLEEATAGSNRALSEEFLNNAGARLNHARFLAYMGSQRGELPCNEPRWESLDIAATAFNALLVEKLSNPNAEPIGLYDAVWVPRSFGGAEPRLKMMPLPEDLVIQQYLLNELLTERWDHRAFSDSTFSSSIPAVRYYREERRTVTTGFDVRGDAKWGEMNNRTFSFGYQIDMDVLEGRQPASDQGMYRPFNDCWRDFMKSVSTQATEIGYVYSIRLDAKRYYDRLRRFVVRDRVLSRLQMALESVTDDTPGFAELLGLQVDRLPAADKAAAVLDRLDEHLFGVKYTRPDDGSEQIADALMGIPQGPVLSAWIGTISLFQLDELANRFFDTYNTDRVRVGYARYVDDIVLLAESPSILEEVRNAMDRCARSLELTLVAKAEEIPPMSALDFTTYINQGRALAASGPAWEPPLVGDGDSGWGFWSVAPTTDRQSALQLLHNVELYKAPPSLLLQTVKTALQAPDLRTSELSKAARLLWYCLACQFTLLSEPVSASTVWDSYLKAWNDCLQGTSWRMHPDKYIWESPFLFALEGLEHLLDTRSRDVSELTAEENSLRRHRIIWLANAVLSPGFDAPALGANSGPRHQLHTRFALVRWKAVRLTGQSREAPVRPDAERSKLVQYWRPFEWMHEAISLLVNSKAADEDPLKPFVYRTIEQKKMGRMQGAAADLFLALLPDEPASNDSVSEGSLDTTMAGIALQTLVTTLPRRQLLGCLGRRKNLIWNMPDGVGYDRLVLPPLPGMTVSRLFSCLVSDEAESGIVVAHGIQAIEISASDTLQLPIFLGADEKLDNSQLALKWTKSPVPSSNGTVLRLETELSADDHLRMREAIQAPNSHLTTVELRQTARLFRAIAQVVLAYASDHDDRELVPAWPYIAGSIDNKVYYLIGDGVSKAELGSRAFVRDGGRALRTVEVPIYEASIWRVGIAVTDYLGLYDDVAKFCSAESDVALDAAALANPARYILRAQLRKLRGAYANSKISRTHGSGSILPASVDRSLQLLETFPSESEGEVAQIIHVLATESESAAMYLSFQSNWEGADAGSFLTALANRVLARLPLSVAKELATDGSSEVGVRRDLMGILTFARRIFAIGTESHVSSIIAWKALCAGTISTGISVAIKGLIASLRSHGSFEKYDSFDFPKDWEIEVGIPNSDSMGEARVSLVAQLRGLIQHLGHRISRESGSPDQLKDGLFGQLRDISRAIADAEAAEIDPASVLEWPFASIGTTTFPILNLDLLERVVEAIKQLDIALGLEVLLVQEYSYGFNAQTKRFADSRNGVNDVTPWMISQFPIRSKHVEEVSWEGRFQRIWSEVFDRRSGKLLSVSVLGEPFASIAIAKQVRLDIPDRQIRPTSDVLMESQVLPNRVGSLGSMRAAREDFDEKETSSQAADDQRDTVNTLTPGLDAAAHVSDLTSEPDAEDAGKREHAARVGREAYAFRRKQFDSWEVRGNKASKQDGHVRVALLQANMDLTYRHPLVEACPKSWPFSSHAIKSVTQHLKSDETYGSLMNSSEKFESAHLWTGAPDGVGRLPSWAEHRRQRILRRVIDSCEALKVDLLVLPEYSVRAETVEWLKIFLRNKNIAVLAGTYMDFRHEPKLKYLTAQVALLWPVPKELIGLLAFQDHDRSLSHQESTDYVTRGLVLEFLRGKKYRSIALEEFFRPPSGTLGPLFKPRDLAIALETEMKGKPSTEAISHLLSQTRLPLKHLLELICSEIFLVSSPANYLHMNADISTMRGRFGDSGTDPDEAFRDLKELAKLLSITGNGIEARRSILAVPAATSRSADYWIAGQASFLAAGTTSVFCNSVGKGLVGGSCFIGRGSWKSEQEPTGYISKITPYQGWSKGIFCNSKHDALSDRDQAVVVADIDPHNMLEGKPRPQTMPSPLQLVAYLPLVETIDSSRTELNLLRILAIPPSTPGAGRPDDAKGNAHDELSLWNMVREAANKLDEKSFSVLWKKFPDPEAIISRSKAKRDNGLMQPTAPFGTEGMFATPANYDWIDVSLTLTEHDEMPKITVPPWKLP
jgi:DNA primase catalytic core